MWLKEDKIIAKKESKGHAQALLIIAGEELGKAAHCWLVRIGVFPINHPDVDYVKKDREPYHRKMTGCIACTKIIKSIFHQSL